MGRDRGGRQHRYRGARLQLCAIRDAGRLAVLVPGRGAARGDDESRPTVFMTPWLLVAGDLTPFGGMDAANHALARYLGSRSSEVHLVTHRAWADLVDLPSVVLHRVWRPLDRHLLGSPLLARQGQRLWQRLSPRGARAVVNGGNCRVAAANWVHYLHAAYQPRVARSAGARARHAVTHQRDVAAERKALREARVVICNSQRTRRDVIDRLGIAG